MKRWATATFNRSVYICCFLTGVCLGLFAAKLGVLFHWTLLMVTVFAGLLAYKRHGWFLVIFCLLAGLLIGLVRGGVFLHNLQKYNVYFDHVVTISGHVSDDPGYTDKKLTEFHISNVVINNVHLPGRVRIRSLSANNVRRGDLVRASGQLRRTIGTSRQGAITYANVVVAQKNTSWSEAARSKFFAAIYSSLPEPQASLGLGYLVGVRTALPVDFAAALSVVGLTHIVAVSGYNLTIIVQFVKRLFSGVSAYQTVFFSSVLIAGFLVATGWSPSIMRAAIISGFSLLAWYYGRSFKPLVIILLGAAITSFISPLYIWGDVGWYLSFMAFAGVLLVAPLCMHFLGRYSKNILVAILVETLAAQIMTLPYISVIFGRISVISPLANMLVIPFIPLSMLLLFLTGAIGMVSPSLALWVAAPAKVIMTFTVWVIENLSKFEWAQSTVQLTVLQAGFIYVLLFGVVLIGWMVYRRRVDGGDEKIDWNLL